ncbi:MAG TPA: peptidylprolyl isomerase [Thermoanaerobaculia bacterium]|nr:peptidylprolyl isomerase [Thermoanaerobaculia bacterium]
MPRVILETTKGRIAIDLDEAKAPKTVANFLEYVRSGHYDGTIFHRVIPGFMAQAGGFTDNMSQKPTRAPIQNEADNGLSNARGTLAMARTGDPHSASAQFFINVADNRGLDHTGKNPQGWGYAVFGKVTEGMDVVDQIVKVPRGRSGFHDDVPKEPIVITKATVEE